ncbi:hypothetical protein CEE39_04425 [bacterium (candidate division B38) B3_B38]|nr:MAG: hypothetical protein CEE39_04425 [bacterium (candidate division B38) B3_B38]
MKGKYIILLIVFLVIAGGLFIYFVFYPEKESPPQPKVSPAPSAELPTPYIDREANLMTVYLFFQSSEGNWLADEERRIYYTTSITDQAKQVVVELIKGPSKSYLLATIPPSTILRELFLTRQGIAYVDFSRQFISDHWGGTTGEMLTIYSIVDTLTINFPSIQKVQILVEGKEIETLAGHLDLRKPLNKDLSLIAQR